MVVIGPSLPDKDAPFNLPKDMGAKVFATKEVEKPRFFHEHFTGTDSWILRSETIRLARPGRYYLVAFSPQGQTGKVWLSVGKRESFSLDDLKEFPAWRRRVREFHEVKQENSLFSSPFGIPKGLAAGPSTVLTTFLRLPCTWPRASQAPAAATC
jgi:hypothetical protein